MKAKQVAQKVVWARRLVQAACLLVFLYLLWRTGAVKEEAAGGVPETRAAPMAFFDLDPALLLLTSLAARALAYSAGLALVTVLGTVLLGRVFCGWVCPFGVVHAVATWTRRFVRDAAPSRDHWTRWQRGKYYLLAVLLVLSLLGTQWVGIFDPISLLCRVTTTALYPGAQYLVEEGATSVYQADPRIGPIRVSKITEPVYQTVRDHVFVRKRQTFHEAAFILALFAGIVLLNLYRPRFWCRYVCPTGALLGWLSQRPVVRLVSKSGCTDCGLCAKRCPAAAEPDKPGAWRATECYGCWNCVAACNRDAIGFAVRSPLRRASTEPLDLSKRALLEAGVAGVGGLVLFRLAPEAQARVYNPELIRPPGSRAELDFLARCVKCGACMKACPTNGLQPTFLQAGLEGIWTPVLTPSIGCCEYNCNLCGQVCPTGAIRPLTLEDKHQERIGLAAFDTTRCLPYAYGRECMICEEHCPTPKKAIYFESVNIRLRSGETVPLKQPRVDPELCVGCGICSNVCVFKDRPAIRVTSANETRHSGNRPILAGSPLQDIPAIPEAAAPEAATTGGDPYGGS